MRSPQILICDDEPLLREMVAEYFEERGYGVLQSATGAEMRAVVEDLAPDIVILDLRMPGEDGLTALRQLRAQNDIPVIMLTAAAETIDRVVGLELGADDYVGKPVDLRELEARVKAVLRRRTTDQSGARQHREPAVQIVEFGPCKLDLAAAKLYGPDGVEITVTAMEFALLRLFSENRGRILTRDNILEKAHDRDWEPYDRSIDLRVSRLRRKIEPNPSKPEVIRTVHGLGYIFG